MGESELAFIFNVKEGREEEERREKTWFAFTSTQEYTECTEYARVYRDMQEFTEVCKSLQKYAKVYRSMQKFTEVRKSFTEICKSLHEVVYCALYSCLYI